MGDCGTANGIPDLDFTTSPIGISDNCLGSNATGIANTFVVEKGSILRRWRHEPSV